jgi:hypothetical protein
VTVIGVAWSGTAAEMQGFVDLHHISFLTLNDADSSLFSHFGVPAQPAWVFVKPNGQSKRVLGAEEPDELTRNLDAVAAG